MSNLSPAPIRSTLADPQGNITQPWTSWLSQLFQRVGGGSASTINDLEIDGAVSIPPRSGASGTFTTADAKTVTVRNGVIVSII